MPNRPNHRKFIFSLRWWLALASFVTLGSSLSQEVVLFLKNGDRLSGRLISENTNSVTIATAYAEKITVSSSEILVRRENGPREIESARGIAATSLTNPPASTLSLGSPSGPASLSTNSAPSLSATTQSAVAQPTPAAMQPKTSSPTNMPTASSAGAVKASPTNKVSTAQLTVPSAAGSTKTNPPSEFKKFLAEWKGEVQAGLNLGFSSADRQLYAARFKATHSHKALRNILDYNASYGRTEGVLSDNRADGSWKVEYDIGKRFLVYNAAGAGYDEIRKIDRHYDLGPGFGYKWIVRTNFVLKTELGGNYQEQFFADETNKKRYSLRLAEDFWWQITGKIRWDEKLEFFPRVDDPSEYRVRVESNLSYLLRNNLTLNLTVIDLYDNATPGSVSHNDLQIRSSIGIKF